VLITGSLPLLFDELETCCPSEFTTIVVIGTVAHVFSIRAVVATPAMRIAIATISQKAIHKAVLRARRVVMRIQNAQIDARRVVTKRQMMPPGILIFWSLYAATIAAIIDHAGINVKT